MNSIDLAETGLVPDSLIRRGIRRLLRQRLDSMPSSGSTEHSSMLRDFSAALRHSPLALATDEANEQHYEVPAEFFERVLGPHLKYSSCLFEDPDAPLEEAEQAMLRLTCERAEIAGEMNVLELGCGWGSLSLWIAEHYPACEVTAVSNSHSQHDFIVQRACQRGLTNLNVVTADMRSFEIDQTFDRIVSVEMFEHLRNYELLLQRVSTWLTPDGKAFVHIFCHRDTPYLFETEGAANWMGRHFFTGGMMPSQDLLSRFDEHLSVTRQWRVCGEHYWRTCEAWLTNLDRNREAVLRRFREDLTHREARRALQRWRIFFMACAELFRYNGGNEWFVGHYLFTHARALAPPAALSGVGSATIG